MAPIFQYITPNQLCYLRILGGIIILFLYMRGHFAWLLPVFLLAVLLDIIDGPLARSTHRVSDEGKNLDPIADKVIISIPLLIVGMNRFGKPTLFMFILVEVLLALTANYLKPYLRQRFGIPLTSGANSFGQLKMTTQSVAVAFLLYDPNSFKFASLAEWLVWLGIAFGIASFLRHLSRMDQPVEPRKRIVTIPTLITLSSLFLFIPAGFALAREQWFIAGVILAWIYVSDVIDGWAARRLHQETSFGAALDPGRDFISKVFLMVWIFVWLHQPMIRITIISIWLVEIITAAVNINTSYRCKTTDMVTRWGKLRGFTQYCLLGVVFFHGCGAYTLSEDWLLVIFLAMLLASLVALISYVDHRRQLLNNRPL